MKHNLKITLILLAMFLITQFIGLAVINSYHSAEQDLPYGMQPPEISPQASLSTIIIAMTIAIFLIFLLMKFKIVWVLRIWFFIVIVIAVGITLNSFLFKFTVNAPWIALAIALPLAFFKIFKRHLLVHNITELMVYPGIAAVFVPLLSIWTIIILLILISAYDIYAVWHTGFMQKMAKYQIDKLKIFAGFFVPYLSKKQRMQIKKMNVEAKKSKSKAKKLKTKKIKVTLAILGGGDVVFPLIMAGIVLVTLGLPQAIIISICATLALLGLFIAAEKGKFYPAMPFITAGCFVGLAIASFI